MRPKPIGPRVLIKPDEATEVARESGIVLPSETAERQRSGIVIAVGSFLTGWDSTEEIEYKPLPLEPGDKVIYARDSGTKVSIVNDETGTAEDFLVLDLQHVLLVLEDEEARVRH